METALQISTKSNTIRWVSPIQLSAYGLNVEWYFFHFKIPLSRLPRGFPSLFLCSQMTQCNCSLTLFWTESCTSPIRCVFAAHFLPLFWKWRARPCGKSIFRSSFCTILLSKPFWPHWRHFRCTFQWFWRNFILPKWHFYVWSIFQFGFCQLCWTTLPSKFYVCLLSSCTSKRLWSTSQIFFWRFEFLRHLTTLLTWIECCQLLTWSSIRFDLGCC